MKFLFVTAPSIYHYGGMDNPIKRTPYVMGLSTGYLKLETIIFGLGNISMRN